MKGRRNEKQNTERDENGADADEAEDQNTRKGKREKGDKLGDKKGKQRNKGEENVQKRYNEEE